jgi:hypothetical protein
MSYHTTGFYSHPGPNRRIAGGACVATPQGLLLGHDLRRCSVVAEIRPSGHSHPQAFYGLHMELLKCSALVARSGMMLWHSQFVLEIIMWGWLHFGHEQMKPEQCSGSSICCLQWVALTAPLYLTPVSLSSALPYPSSNNSKGTREGKLLQHLHQTSFHWLDIVVKNSLPLPAACLLPWHQFGPAWTGQKTLLAAAALPPGIIHPGCPWPHGSYQYQKIAPSAHLFCCALATHFLPLDFVVGLLAPATVPVANIDADLAASAFLAHSSTRAFAVLIARHCTSTFCEVVSGSAGQAGASTA